MTKYGTSEVKLDLDPKMAYIRYPETGYLSSMDVTDVDDIIDGLIKIQNEQMSTSLFTHRIVMDGPNQYHIDIFHRLKGR